MEEKRKYLEYFDGAFDPTVAEKMKPENWPYVGSSKTEGVVYTVITEGPTSAYQMVDLGLSVKWADRNVGASSPEDAGLYFQWGDTVGYTADQVGKDKVFSLDTYFDTTDGGNTYNKYSNEGGLTTLESEDDAATIHMGVQYRTPTIVEIQELIANTQPTFIDMQGNEFTREETFGDNTIAEGNFKGIRFTSKINGNSIFIPAAGTYDEFSEAQIHSHGLIPSSDLSSMTSKYLYCLSFNNYGHIWDDGMSYRYKGQPVRGVRS